MATKKRNFGFSLVGVIVTSALIGALALVFADMLLNSQKGQKSIENSIDFDILRSSISMLFTKPSLCANAFLNSEATPGKAQFKAPSEGVVAPQKKLHTLKMGPSTIASVGLNLGGGLKISKLDLQFVSQTAPNNYQVELIVEVSKSTGSLGPAVLSNVSNPFHLDIVTNSSSEIIGCGSTTGVQFRTCTDAQSEAGPSAVPECVAAAANSGGGTLSGPIKAVPINCMAPGFTKGRFAGNVHRVPNNWKGYGSMFFNCVDGTLLIAYW